MIQRGGRKNYVELGFLADKLTEVVLSVHGGTKSRNYPGAELNATLIQDSVGNSSCATRKIVSLQIKKNVVCKLKYKENNRFYFV